MQNRDPKLEISGNPIGFYEREFYMFSNFSSFQVEWMGRLWQTSEHAYQAAKFFNVDKNLVDDIENTKSAHDAFKLARKNNDKKPKDWKKRSLMVMLDICRHKLDQHKYIQKKLLTTKNVELVEDSLKDDFWGWGPNKDGNNELGKIWMKLRDKLQNRQNVVD